MKVLITGGNGQLGRCLQDELKAQNIIFFAPSRAALDVQSDASLTAAFEQFQPTVVINAAAYTAVDKAESDRETAFSVNSDAVAALSLLCVQHDIPLYHVSTDYVFDGNSAARYVETSKTNPMSIYGQSKLAGESHFIASGVKGLIIRTSWLYSEYGNNFFKTMLRLAEAREELTVVTDQIGVPTYARDLARFLLHLIVNCQLFPSTLPIVHFCNNGVASWYDFAFDIMQQHKPEVSVRPISTVEYPTPARRPSASVMSNVKASKEFGFTNRHWRLALQECHTKFSQISAIQADVG